MIADHLVFPVSITSRDPYTVSGAFPGLAESLERMELFSPVIAQTAGV
jgi:hypothetical protein